MTAHAVLAEGFAVGGTVAFTIGTLISLLMITFGASSMDGAVRNQAAAQGQQPLTYVGNLLNGYLASLSGSLGMSTLAHMFSQGTTYNSDGDIFLNEECSGFVADFQRWAWDEDGADLQSYAPLIDSDIISYQGFNIALISLDTSLTVNEQPYYGNVLRYRGSNRYFLASRNSDARYYVTILNNQGTLAAEVFPYNEYSASYVQVTSSSSGIVQNFSLPRARWSNITSTTDTSFTYVWPISEAKSVDDLNNIDPSTLSFGETFVGDPETYPETGATQTRLSEGDIKAAIAAGHWQANIQDYLDTLANGYAGNVTSIPMTNEDTGEEETFPLTVPLDTPIAVDTVTDAEVGDQTDASEGVSSEFLGTEAYTLDLTQFFPFCVPFDLYHILEKFEASAEAPAFTWEFDFGQAGTYELEIDFDDFSGVAAILRDIETVAFAVGLILLTKRLIQGGD